MATAINMIRVGLTMKVGSISKWVKKVGDPCKKGEAVAEMETEKLTYDIPAPADGVLLAIVTGENVEVPIGHLLGYIGQPGEAVPDDAKAEEKEAPAAAAPEPPKPAVNRSVRISPAARKLAEEKGVDYAALSGTGPGGRITVDDVEKAAAPAPEPEPEPAPAPAAEDEYELLALTPMRKAIAKNMELSWSTSPRVTHHARANAAALIALRAQLNEGAEKAKKITVTDLLAKLTAKALMENPRLNSSLTDEGIKLHKKANIGIAVAIDDGLLVPVVHDACAKGLYEVSAEIKDLAARAKTKKLIPAEMSGATFTITNLGMYKSVEFFSPIINQPEAAILGVGKTVETPVIKDGQVVAAPMMGLSLTFDHRIIDGSTAAEFLESLIDHIENPAKALLQ